MGLNVVASGDLTKLWRKWKQLFFFVFVFVFFCLLVFLSFSRAAPMAYGDSQPRGLIRAVAAGLCQSHGNEGSELHLQTTPQLTAAPDP